MLDAHTDRAVTHDESAARQWARERAEMLQALYIHVLTYVVVNVGLFGINLLTRGDDGAWWFYWPLLGWGVGLLVHILVTTAPVFSSRWLDKKTEQLARRS